LSSWDLEVDEGLGNGERAREVGENGRNERDGEMFNIGVGGKSDIVCVGIFIATITNQIIHTLSEA
jgi:hypothetical protein